MPRRDEQLESDGAAQGDSRRSGVVEKSAALRILVVEPENYVRAELEAGARSESVRFVMTASPDEAELVRAREPIDFVACTFPGPGVERFVRSLRGERFPVVVMTSRVERAVEVFGLRVPVLRRPVDPAQLLQQAIEMVQGVTMAPRVGDDGDLVLHVVEIAPPPNPRDPRRQ